MLSPPRPWLHSPDPDFRPKVRRICELYLEPPEDAVVLCVDEEPMQALSRKHSTHSAPDAAVRYEFEYARHSTCVLLGAFDVRTGKVFGQVVAHRNANSGAFCGTAASIAFAISKLPCSGSFATGISTKHTHFAGNSQATSFKRRGA